ncbi:MAG: GspE/PulE/PilB domain-containing protein, partial [Planctomycetota bacterium]
MKDLLIQAAERSGIVNAATLNDFFTEHADDARRVDQVLLSAPNFTEDVVLRLFAEAMGIEFFEEISDKDVPAVFIEHVPASYAQHHYVIGYQPEDANGTMTVITANPLDMMVVDNVSKMLAVPVDTALSTRAAITSAIDVAY